MPAKKIRCTAKDCRDAAQRIVGDCGFCQGHFCGKHRLLEDHKCSGLEDCKKESHERNAAQLESERTQMIRGVSSAVSEVVAVTIDERLKTRRCD
ncbi:AN1-type zinc finger protein TMC1 like [Verticillium longisporum]|nr:AN1-type zinc finger protein TMC1 like [Verticillium longisporum]